MNEKKIQLLLPALLDIARAAGDAILEVYARDFSVMQKDDESPLTQADLASHVIITDALAALTPNIPVLSEESANIDFETRSCWETYWLVDPLDGTKEFVNRNGEFTVNIALIHQHEAIAGVVHVPVTGASYSGVRGAGAFRYHPDHETQSISVRPCGDPIVVVGSRSHGNPKLDPILSSLDRYEMVSMGSSLKFCVLAEGNADFYPRLGLTSEWDTAAAHAVVSAAGGQIIRLDGHPLEYNRKESLLNPDFLVFGDATVDWQALFEGYGSA